MHLSVYSTYRRQRKSGGKTSGRKTAPPICRNVMVVVVVKSCVQFFRVSEAVSTKKSLIEATMQRASFRVFFSFSTDLKAFWRLSQSRSTIQPTALRFGLRRPCVLAVLLQTRQLCYFLLLLPSRVVLYFKYLHTQLGFCAFSAKKSFDRLILHSSKSHDRVKSKCIHKQSQQHNFIVRQFSNITRQSFSSTLEASQKEKNQLGKVNYLATALK